MRSTIVFLLFSMPLFALSQSTEVKKYSLLDGKLSLSAPAALREMTKDEYAYKYRNHAEPTLAITDENLEVNLIVQPLDQPLKQEQIAEFNSFQAAQIKKKRPDAEILGSGVKSINGHKLGWVKFVIKASDQKVYNHLFFTDVKGKGVMFNFNSVAVKQEEWAPKADAVMASIVVQN